MTTSADRQRNARRTRDIERVHVPRCGVCGAEERMRFYPPAHVVECLGCGVLYVSPRPTHEAIAEFYSRQGHYDQWDEQSGRAQMWRRRVERIRALVPSGRLLDIGAGRGDFGAQARRYYEVEGTEVSSEGAQLAKDRHGLEIRLGDVLELDLPKAHYDIITMWHVLEHVAEPRAVLERCRELLKPGGVICVAVPNTDHQYKMARAELRATVQLVMRRPPDRGVVLDHIALVRPEEEVHLTHFTMRTLTSLMRSLDLTILETGLDDYSPHNDPRTRLKQHCLAFMDRRFGVTIGRAIFVAARAGRRAGGGASSGAR